MAKDSGLFRLKSLLPYPAPIIEMLKKAGVEQPFQG